MVSPAQSLYPVPPIVKPRDLATEWWLIVLREQLRLVRSECLHEMASTHPGARHRVAELLLVSARIAGQIEAAGGQS